MFQKTPGFARMDNRISSLLAPFRKTLSALERYGAEWIGGHEQAGHRFVRYELIP